MNLKQAKKVLETWAKKREQALPRAKGVRVDGVDYSVRVRRR
jgi:hypothetical protein